MASVLVESLEERVAEVYRGEVGAAILAAAGRLHFAAEHVAHELCAVTYTEDGHTASELAEVHLESLGVIDAVGAACQYDADDVGIADRELVVGQYLAEGIELAQAACNKLCRLRAEVQNDNFLLLHRSKRIH